MLVNLTPARSNIGTYTMPMFEHADVFFEYGFGMDWSPAIFRNGSHAITSLEHPKYFATIWAIKLLSLAVDNKS